MAARDSYRKQVSSTTGEYYIQGVQVFYNDGPLGAGNQGQVWPGLLGERRLALKEFANDSEGALISEIGFMKSIQGALPAAPVVPYLGIFPGRDGKRLLAMPLYEEGSLQVQKKNLIAQRLVEKQKSVGPFEFSFLVNILISVAEAIVMIHSIDIIHADIAARNIRSLSKRTVPSEPISLTSDYQPAITVQLMSRKRSRGVPLARRLG